MLEGLGVGGEVGDKFLEIGVVVFGGFEEVQMVRFDVGYEQDFWVQRMKRFAVFAGFNDEVFGLPYSVIVAVELWDFGADDYCGVEAGLFEDQRKHGGGGGFAMSAGNGDGEIFTTEVAKGFWIAFSGDSEFFGAEKFDIVCGDGWRIDH